MKYKQANEEFDSIAKELFELNREKLRLSVDPSKVIFLRSNQKTKNTSTIRYAYCRRIHGEYELLTTKKFFIVIMSENFDALETDDMRKYVILHELNHLHFDEDKEKYCLLKHNLQEFNQLLVNPAWNLSLVKTVASPKATVV